MPGPIFPQFTNFLAASRKPMLISSGYFSPNDSTSWIYAPPSSGGAGPPQNLTGTVDGANTVFTVPTTIVNGVAIYRNGVLQDPLVSYSITGQTVTFNSQNIPQTGDDLQCIVS